MRESAHCIKPVALKNDEIALFSWNYHNADIVYQHLSIIVDKIKSESFSIPPFYKLGYSDMPESSRVRTFSGGDRVLDLKMYPPLTGFEAVVSGSRMDIFQQTFDGCLYRQEFSFGKDLDEIAHSSEFQDSLDSNQFQEEIVENEIDYPTKYHENVILKDEITKRNVEKMVLYDLLAERDTRGEIGGVSLKLYPPAPLSEDTSIKSKSIYQFQSVWKGIFF